MNAYDGTLTITDPNLVTTYRHEDGSTTYLVLDNDCSDRNPRNDAGNVATLVNRNSHTIDLDDDDLYLGDVVAAWARRSDRSEHLARYIRIFHPEVLYFTEHWSAGDSYGYGYVTRANWVRWMGEDYSGDLTPEAAFDQEVRVYGLWANGEVYGFRHVDPTGEEESVWGFLGYDSPEEIVKQATNSAIVSEE